MKASTLTMLGCLIELLMTTGLRAQYVGLSIGHTVSTVDWEYPTPSVSCVSCAIDGAPNQSRRALAPAIVVQWGAARWLGIASELRYTMKGFARTQPTLNVEYLEVPVLLRIGRLTYQGSPVSIFAEAGPALAIKARCSMLYNDTSGGCENGVLPGQDWRIGQADVSGILGLGGALRIRRSVVMIGGRIDWGLRDIGGGSGVPTKNRSSLLYAGLLWDVHHAH